MLGLAFSSKLDWGSYVIPFAESVSIRIDFFYDVSFSWGSSVSL